MLSRVFCRLPSFHPHHHQGNNGVVGGGVSGSFQEAARIDDLKDVTTTNKEENKADNDDNLSGADDAQSDADVTIRHKNYSSHSSKVVPTVVPPPTPPASDTGDTRFSSSALTTTTTTTTAVPQQQQQHTTRSCMRFLDNPMMMTNNNSRLSAANKKQQKQQQKYVSNNVIISEEVNPYNIAEEDDDDDSESSSEEWNKPYNFSLIDVDDEQEGENNSPTTTSTTTTQTPLTDTKSLKEHSSNIITSPNSCTVDKNSNNKDNHNHVNVTPSTTSSTPQPRSPPSSTTITTSGSSSSVEEQKENEEDNLIYDRYLQFVPSTNNTNGDKNTSATATSTTTSSINIIEHNPLHHDMIIAKPNPPPSYSSLAKNPTESTSSLPFDCRSNNINNDDDGMHKISSSSSSSRRRREYRSYESSSSLPFDCRNSNNNNNNINDDMNNTISIIRQKLNNNNDDDILMHLELRRVVSITNQHDDLTPQEAVPVARALRKAAEATCCCNSGASSSSSRDKVKIFESVIDRAMGVNNPLQRVPGDQNTKTTTANNNNNKEKPLSDILGKLVNGMKRQQDEIKILRCSLKHVTLELLLGGNSSNGGTHSRDVGQQTDQCHEEQLPPTTTGVVQNQHIENDDDKVQEEKSDDDSYMSKPTENPQQQQHPLATCSQHQTQVCIDDDLDAKMKSSETQQKQNSTTIQRGISEALVYEMQQRGLSYSSSASSSDILDDDDDVRMGTTKNYGNDQNDGSLAKVQEKQAPVQIDEIVSDQLSKLEAKLNRNNNPEETKESASSSNEDLDSKTQVISNVHHQRSSSTQETIDEGGNRFDEVIFPPEQQQISSQMTNDDSEHSSQQEQKEDIIMFHGNTRVVKPQAPPRARNYPGFVYLGDDNLRHVEPKQERTIIPDNDPERAIERNLAVGVVEESASAGNSSSADKVTATREFDANNDDYGRQDDPPGVDNSSRLSRHDDLLEESRKPVVPQANPPMPLVANISAEEEKKDDGNRGKIDPTPDTPDAPTTRSMEGEENMGDESTKQEEVSPEFLLRWLERNKREEDQNKGPKVIRWLERNADDPDNYEDACQMLCTVIYKDGDEEHDMEKMLRRTAPKDLYYYLKQQYWYLVYTGVLEETALQDYVDRFVEEQQRLGNQKDESLVSPVEDDSINSASNIVEEIPTDEEEEQMAEADVSENGVLSVVLESRQTDVACDSAGESRGLGSKEDQLFPLESLPSDSSDQNNAGGNDDFASTEIRGQEVIEPMITSDEEDANQPSLCLSSTNQETGKPLEPTSGILHAVLPSNRSHKQKLDNTRELSAIAVNLDVASFSKVEGENCVNSENEAVETNTGKGPFLADNPAEAFAKATANDGTGHQLGSSKIEQSSDGQLSDIEVSKRDLDALRQRIKSSISSRQRRKKRPSVDDDVDIDDRKPQQAHIGQAHADVETQIEMHLDIERSKNASSQTSTRTSGGNENNHRTEQPSIGNTNETPGTKTAGVESRRQNEINNFLLSRRIRKKSRCSTDDEEDDRPECPRRASSSFQQPKDSDARKQTDPAALHEPVMTLRENKDELLDEFMHTDDMKPVGPIIEEKPPTMDFSEGGPESEEAAGSDDRCNAVLENSVVDESNSFDPFYGDTKKENKTVFEI